MIKAAINRTKLELKHMCDINGIGGGNAINRTKLELKPQIIEPSAPLYNAYQSNQTGIETANSERPKATPTIDLTGICVKVSDCFVLGVKKKPNQLLSNLLVGIH